MSDSFQNNRRIAKNTLLLYFRMILLMIVSLYTSRVTLEALGVEDYGIYNVVGGVVAMFHIMSNSLSGAISRFLNYEMGVGHNDRLRDVFATSVNIQIGMALAVFIVAELLGGWFLNCKMNIPENRMYAANWVFQFSIFTFVVNLISVPYNACIVAHERMKAFAYVSIIEAVLKLVIVYMLMLALIDTLIFYAILQFSVALIIRMIYGNYCSRNFSECRYRFVMERPLIKEMASYAGWNLVGTSAGLLRSQGVNILINLFFGPAVNAARGLSMQVNTAVQQFITNFTTALNPQITQSYAAGRHDYCLQLVINGARFGFYMLLLLSLPIIIETEMVLGIWLNEVPEHTVWFVRLILIYSLVSSLSVTLMRLQASTGIMRNYQLVVGGWNLLNIPVDFVLLKWCGMRPEGVIVVAIIIEACALFARLYMVGRLTPLNETTFIKKVVANTSLVLAVAIIVPMIVHSYYDVGIIRFLSVSIICFISTASSVYYIGCSNNEREKVISYIKKINKVRICYN